MDIIKTEKEIKKIFKAGHPLDETVLYAETSTGKYQWDKRDEQTLLSRAKEMDKERKIKGNGEFIQKLMKFVHETPGLAQVLFNLRHIQRSNPDYSIQKCCKILFNGKTDPPPGIVRKHKGSVLTYEIKNKDCENIDPYIKMLDYLPPAWIKDIKIY